MKWGYCARANTSDGDKAFYFPLYYMNWTYHLADDSGAHTIECPILLTPGTVFKTETHEYKVEDVSGYSIVCYKQDASAKDSLCGCGGNAFVTKQNGPHLSAYCTECGAFIKHVPQNNSMHSMPFGKHKGRKIAEMTTKEDLDYLKWLLDKSDNLKDNLRQPIEAHIKRLKAR